MAGRIVPLVSGQYYHVFNRGVARQPTFLGKLDYRQALLGVSYYRLSRPPVKLSYFKKFPRETRDKLLDNFLSSQDLLVRIVSFVLMPNHFHFLLQQVRENGVSSFLSKFTNSYTKYFNTRYKREGSLFQGTFKAVRIETDEQLLHVSRYIHLNPVVSYVIKESDLVEFPWSSLPDYLDAKRKSFVWREPVIGNFSSKDGYKKFLLDQVKYGKKLEEIKHLMLDER